MSRKASAEVDFKKFIGFVEFFGFIVFIVYHRKVRTEMERLPRRILRHKASLTLISLDNAINHDRRAA